MWGGLPCIYMRILWKEVFNPIHFKTLFVYPYRDISSIIKVGCRTIRPCSGLTSLTLPAGITSIGISAFAYCSGLTSLTLPAGITSIDKYAFLDCSGLTSLTLPDGITSIGSRAFYGCI